MQKYDEDELLTAEILTNLSNGLYLPYNNNTPPSSPDDFSHGSAFRPFILGSTSSTHLPPASFQSQPSSLTQNLQLCKCNGSKPQDYKDEFYGWVCQELSRSSTPHSSSETTSPVSNCSQNEKRINYSKCSCCPFGKPNVDCSSENSDWKSISNRENYANCVKPEKMKLPSMLEVKIENEKCSAICEDAQSIVAKKEKVSKKGDGNRIDKTLGKVRDSSGKNKFHCPRENCNKVYGKSSHLRSHIYSHDGE